MKKILSILLSLVLILGLCACGGSGEKTPETPANLQIGFSRINVTPTYDVSLHGYGEEKLRITSTFTHYIYITCIAAKYGEDTILVYTLDIGSLRNGVPELIRQSASEATGIPGENIVFGATHTHSGPSLFYDSAANQRYQSEYYQHIATAGKMAVRDLADATVSSTQFEIEGMNFVRHYIMKDGSVAGPNFGDTSLGFTGHPTDPDRNMILVKFDRPEGKDDILLVNWSAHPANSSAIGRNIMSPDFIGPLRDKVEKQTGMKVAYFTGASGNVISHSYWKEENHGLAWNTYGEKLADHAIENLPKLEPVEVNSLRHSQQVYTGTVDHTQDHMLVQCQEINKVAFTDQNRTLANKMALELGLTSYYHAYKITTNAKLGPTAPLEMNAFAIGPIGFITADYEMFSDASVAIRQDSPFKHTLIMCTNKTYMPSDAAFEYGSYESSQTYFIRGTAETMVDEYLKMLNNINQ